MRTLNSIGYDCVQKLGERIATKRYEAMEKGDDAFESRLNSIDVRVVFREMEFDAWREMKRKYGAKTLVVPSGSYEQALQEQIRKRLGEDHDTDAAESDVRSGD